MNKNELKLSVLFNVPNSLTLLRIVLAPLVFWAIVSGNYWTAAVLFLIASLTDFFDGYLARRMNMGTSIGRILDPIADKIFIFFSVIALLIKFHFPLWAGLIIVSRDILILIFGLFLLGRNKNIVLAPSNLGKISTFFQMTTILIFVLASIFDYNSFWIDILIYVTVLLTLVSGIAYLSKLPKLLKDKR